MTNINWLLSGFFFIIFHIGSIQCGSGYKHQSIYRSEPCKTCDLEVPECDPNSPYRRIDGSCNNLQYPNWAITDDTYKRLVHNRYSDGVSAPRKSTDGSALPLVRVLRTTLFSDGDPVDPVRTLNSMQFGQVIVHDMTFLKQPDEDPGCCTEDGKFTSCPGQGCLPIEIPDDDTPLGAAGISCVNFIRTVTDQDLGCCTEGEPAKQINTATSYLDLSNVYGTTESAAANLRSYRGGKLKAERRNGQSFPPSLTGDDKSAVCPCNLPSEKYCYLTGDPRSMSSPDLAILQIMLFREHNRIATNLAKLNPCWDDDRLYNEARKINIAAYQHIVYNEWIPVILDKSSLYDEGILVDAGCGYVNDYNPEVNAKVSSEFSQSALRYFHSAVMGALNKLNADRSVNSTIDLNVWFDRGQILEVNKKSLKQLSLGMVTQTAAQIDNFFAEPITEKLDTCRGIGFGGDLRAIDLQRDRDHALGYYNDYRDYCGLPKATCWEDYLDWVPADSLEQLKQLYNSHEDVDMSVAAALENNFKDSTVGPIFYCLIADQFRRTRQGDRFFYEHEDAGFTLDQLAEIRKANIAKLFCQNMQLDEIQTDAFAAISDSNPLQPCCKLPSVNLKLWKDDCDC